MKKNVVFALLGIFAVLGSIGYVKAHGQSSLISFTLPLYGGKLYNSNVGVMKDSNDDYSTFTTVYTKTSLKPQGILATNEHDPRSEWTTLRESSVSYAKNDAKTVKGKVYYSGAKSHNFEPTDQTLVKYYFSPDDFRS